MSLISAVFLNKNNKNYDFNIDKVINFFEKNYSKYEKKRSILKSESSFHDLENLFISSLDIKYPNLSRNLISNGEITVLASGSIYEDDYHLEGGNTNQLKGFSNLSEIILKGYLNSDINFFSKLKGSFVSVILDKSKKRIIVTRDRFGSNLLFFAKGEWGLAFSSKIKSLLTLSYISNKPNWGTIEKYLFHNYRYAFGTDETFFEDIKLISPNSLNIFNFNGKLISKSKLYKSIHSPINQISDQNAIKKFTKLMNTSLEKRLQNLEEKPAFLLSGGLDSPTVAALASKICSEPIVCYSICYGKEKVPLNELSYDERDLIKKIVQKNQIDWRAIYVKPDNFEDIYDDMSRVHDEPIASPTWYSHWLLMEKISKDGFKTVFGGDGGDHALAGLYDDIPYYFADLKFKRMNNVLDKELNLWIKYHSHPVYKKDKALWEKYCESCFDWSQQGRIKNYSWDEGNYRNIYSYKSLASKSFQNINDNLPLFPSEKNTFLLSKLHQDLVYTSSPPSTRAEVPNCENFNIDLRSVFLDYEVINFCWSLPQNLMIRDGYTKYLIRIAMGKYLPKEVNWNKKHVGLNSPANVWFRNELKDLMDKTIRWEGWSDLKIFESTKLFSIWEDHLNLRNDHMMFLWKVFSLKKWLEKNI